MSLVTVIMATYNWATVLPYSIGSVLDQTFSDFELLVIGDGCTDESGEVVAAIGDRRVHWHNLAETSGHQAGPNNEGLRRAEGEVVAYLGHDDLWLPRHLEALLEAVDAGAPMAHGTTLEVLPDRRPRMWPVSEWVYDPGSAITPTAVVHDRALAQDVGGWRMPRHTGPLLPEADLWRRMAAASHPPRWVRTPTNVKLPAASRRDVYRHRPHHEQDYWLRRVRDADDPELLLLAACDEDYVYAEEHPRRVSLPARLVESLRRRVRLRSRLRRRGVLPKKRSRVTAEEHIRSTRRFKGLDG